jgi:hypothetical protein
LVDDFRAHRAVIEQAKGIVIQLFAVDADEAFDRLRACSQAANVKVRDLASTSPRGTGPHARQARELAQPGRPSRCWRRRATV